MGEEKEKLYVRILLEKIRFKDSYEQQKFEQLKLKNSGEAIKQIENLLEQQTITMSFD